MTLLTRSMNSAVRNSGFETKRKEYKKTNLSLTRDLAALTGIGEDFLKERHNMIVNALFTDLSL